MAILTDVLVILVSGGGLSWLSQPVGVPNALSQVLLGVLLGSAVLGWIAHTPVLHAIAEICVVQFRRIGSDWQVVHAHRSTRPVTED